MDVGEKYDFIGFIFILEIGIIR